MDADDTEQRIKVLLGIRQVTPATSRPPRGPLTSTMMRRPSTSR